MQIIQEITNSHQFLCPRSVSGEVAYIKYKNMCVILSELMLL